MQLQFRKLNVNLPNDTNGKSSLRIPYFILTISLITTCFITYFFYSNAKTIDRARFNNEVIEINNAVNSKLETYIALLRASRGYLLTNNNIDRKSFEEFVGYLRLEEFYPGLQGIGYSEIYKPDEKEELKKRMVAEGYQNFKLTPETDRNEYQAILYIAPATERNLKAVGYDMGSEPVRKLSLDTARDTGKFALSGKVLLIQDNTTPGFLIHLPVYETKYAPTTIEERRAKIKGFIYSPFRANDFVKDVKREISNDYVSFKIYDQSVDENNLLAVGNENAKLLNIDLVQETTININNRNWVIVYRPTQSFSSQSLTWWTLIIFLLGSTISVILFALSFSQSQINQKLLRTTNELIESQNKVQSLLNSEKKAREKAEQANQVKSDFISTVSHELRTPLNAIAGWLPILKPETIKPEIKNKALNTIDKNLRQQVQLVEDMIVFSDTDYLDNLNYDQVFSMNSLVSECLLDFKSKLSEAGLTTIKILNSKDDLVKGNQLKLKKTLLRLLDNAIKFSPNGGTITVQSDSVNNLYKLRITDTGEGIELEKLPRIFGNFSQIDSGTTRKHGGLGLGLAIAKKVIEHHHGEIFVNSEGLGKGTSININLPIAL